MACSMLSSSLSFPLISNGNVASTPKPSSYFFPPSNVSALRPPTKISASSPPSQPPPDCSDSYAPAETDENVPFTVALARARERKKNELADKPAVQNAAAGSEESKNDRDTNVPLSVKLALKKAREYKKKKGLAGTGGNAAEKQTLSDFFEKKKTGGMPAGVLAPVDPFPDGDFPEVEIIVGDTSKFGDGGASKPKLTKEGRGSGSYKPQVSSWGASSSPSDISKTNAAVTEEMKSDSNSDIPLSVKLAKEKAKEYKKNKGLPNVGGNAPEEQMVSGSQEVKMDNQRDSVVEKKEEPRTSSIDFLGLDFSENKKTRGMPAGLLSPSDPYPDGDFPEVEIIIGDTSKFGEGSASKTKLTTEDEGSGLYKPKVTSWRASPSPSNISKKLHDQNAAATEEMKSDSNGDIPLSFQLAMEKAKEYKKNKELTNAGGNVPEKRSVLGSQEMMKLDNQRDSVVEKKEEPGTSGIDFLGLDFSENEKTRGMPAGLLTPLDPFPDGDFPEVEIIVGDPSKFGDGSASKTKLTTEDEGSGLYKPKVTSWGASPSPSNISKKNVAVTEEMKSDSSGDIPLSFQLAMEKAKEYKKNKRLTNAGGNAPEKQAVLGSQEMKLDNRRNSVVEKKEEPRASSIDFLGLDFSEKKKTTRGMPAGLLAPLDPFPDGDFPEVEIIVGDTSKFGDGSASKTKLTTEDEDSGLYKPKVTSWGASPSPSNTSKTNAAVTEDMKSDSDGDIPLSFKLAMEKAKENKKNKGHTNAGGNVPEKQAVLGSQEMMKLDNQRNSVVEKKEELGTSGIDFLGLDFSEKKKKKTRGMPAGLLTPLDPFPDGDFPEVEIIVGDPSKFGDGSASKTNLTAEDEGSGLYKPKVTSWGASPSPSNISKKNATVTEEMKSDSNGDTPLSFQLAMEKAKEFKNKGVTYAGGNAPDKQTILGSQEMKLDNQRDSVVEKNEEQKKISSIDFSGLDFSDKKKNGGMPAGLVTPVDPFSDEDIPEVEIVTGDSSRVGGAASKPKPIQEDQGSELYKPKVSSWGVFPRPSNISRTFGGGRTIHPGEVLESAVDRAAKEARTRRLLAAYSNELTAAIDPKIKLECEKALDDGNGLMDIGKLEEALLFFEKVMKDVDYRTELHGWAALQWAICQDSLCRSNVACPIYEKLKSHPNAEVSRKARHFAFGFEAMEMMKVNACTSFSPTSTGYMDYFDAFVDGKSNYSPAEEENENMLGQVLPYAIFLLSPILLVLLIASRKFY